MSDEQENKPAAKVFGNISEADRKAALEVFGRMLIEARDGAIIQWDQILEGRRKYAPWERLLDKFPDLDQSSRKLIAEVLPHIVDTFMYCVLGELQSPDNDVQISAKLAGKMVSNVARLSWGLAAEPAGNDGWLARFSKQRFEQPF